MNKKKGFTLVEIIVVLVIMGILLAIAVPAILGYVKKADEQKYIVYSRNVFLQTQTEVAEANAKNELNTNEDASELLYAVLEEYAGEKIEEYTVESLFIFFDGLPNYGELDMDATSHSVHKIVVMFNDGTDDGNMYALFKSNDAASIVYDTGDIYK